MINTKAKINVFEKNFFTPHCSIWKQIKKNPLILAFEVKPCGFPKLHFFSNFKTLCKDDRNKVTSEISSFSLQRKVTDFLVCGSSVEVE